MENPSGGEGEKEKAMENPGEGEGEKEKAMENPNEGEGEKEKAMENTSEGEGEKEKCLRVEIVVERKLGSHASMELGELQVGKKVMRVLKRAKQSLEHEHKVHISKSSRLAIIDALKASYYPNLAAADKSEVCGKAEDILERACMTVAANFKNCAYQSVFWDWQDELCRALVDVKELCRAQDNGSCGWLTRAQHERDESSLFLADFLARSRKILDSSVFPWISSQDEAYKLRMFQSFALKLEKEQLSTVSPQMSKNVKSFVMQVYHKLMQAFNWLSIVKANHVQEVVSSLTDVPMVELAPLVGPFKEAASRMTKQRLVGQDSTIDGIFEVLAASHRGSGRVGARPRGLFLLVGRCGAGITEIAKAVAQHWYGDASRLIEIDMGEFYDDNHSLMRRVHELTPRKERTLQLFWSRLAEVVTKRPYSVILLDVAYVAGFCIKNLLEVLHSNAPTDAGGHAVDLSKSIIFMAARRERGWLSGNCICFVRTPAEFERTHDCSPKILEDAIDIGKRLIGAKVFDSMVDKVFVVDRPCNEKAVCRMLLREIAREVGGGRLLVHISDAALVAMLWNSRANFTRSTPAKALKEMLVEEVQPRLLAARDCYSNNAVIYIDTLVGTDELSFRFETNKRALTDFYFKQQDGTFGNVLANLRVKVQSACKFFEFKKQIWLHLGPPKRNCKLGRSLLYMCKYLSNFSPLIGSSPSFKRVTRGKTASFDITKEKEKLKDMKMRLSAKANKSPAEAAVTHVIITALAKTIDAPLDDFLPKPVRCHLVLCPNNDDSKKQQLIACLTESLASIFTYINLRNNSRGGHQLKRLLVEGVKKRPFAVFMLDGVECADVVLYSTLLQILDEATLDDNYDQPVDFRRAIIILTSDTANERAVANFFDTDQNTGQGGAELLPQPSQKRRKIARIDIAHRCVKEVKRFRTELLNRVGEIIVFNSLEQRDFRRLSKCDSFTKCSAPNFVSFPSLIKLFQCGDRDDSFIDYIEKESSSDVKFHLFGSGGDTCGVDDDGPFLLC